MAMSMKGHVLLPAARERVWGRLDDPATLKACIPGCQSLERTGENAFAAVAKVKVGPVMRRSGQCRLSTSIRPTVTGFPEAGRAASPASPRATRASGRDGRGLSARI